MWIHFSRCVFLFFGLSFDGVHSPTSSFPPLAFEFFLFTMEKKIMKWIAASEAKYGFSFYWTVFHIDAADIVWMVKCRKKESHSRCETVQQKCFSDIRILHKISWRQRIKKSCRKEMVIVPMKNSISDIHRLRQYNCSSVQTFSHTEFIHRKQFFSLCHNGTSSDEMFIRLQFYAYAAQLHVSCSWKLSELCAEKVSNISSCSILTFLRIKYCCTLEKLYQKHMKNRTHAIWKGGW